MRGEDGIYYMKGSEEVGSPPHARGRPVMEFAVFAGLGITPACAGKTEFLPFRLRARGGSPPHARGRLSMRTHRNSCRGITPACAGKTVSA